MTLSPTRGPGKAALERMQLVDRARATPGLFALYLVAAVEAVLPAVRHLAQLAGGDLLLECGDRVCLHNGARLQVRVAGTPARRGDDVPAAPGLVLAEAPPAAAPAPRQTLRRRVTDRTHPDVPAGWSVGDGDESADPDGEVS